MVSKQTAYVALTIVYVICGFLTYGHSYNHPDLSECATYDTPKAKDFCVYWKTGNVGNAMFNGIFWPIFIASEISIEVTK